MSKTKLALDVVENLRSLAESIEAVVNAVTESNTAAPTPPPANEAASHPDINHEAKAEKAVTLVELRAFVAERSTPENRPKIKEILTRYGVKKLTELTEDKFSAVMREVATL